MGNSAGRTIIIFDLGFFKYVFTSNVMKLNCLFHIVSLQLVQSSVSVSCTVECVQWDLYHAYRCEIIAFMTHFRHFGACAKAFILAS